MEDFQKEPPESLKKSTDYFLNGILRRFFKVISSGIFEKVSSGIFEKPSKEIRGKIFEEILIGRKTEGIPSHFKRLF